jgi:hypothetical protein
MKYPPDGVNLSKAGLQLAATFFTAAVNYYKHNFLLKPFPPRQCSSCLKKSVDGNFHRRKTRKVRYACYVMRAVCVVTLA